MSIPRGLYDQLVTESLARSLPAAQGAPVFQELPAGEVPARLADEMGRQLGRLLAELEGPDTGKVRRQVELVNGMLRLLRERHPAPGAAIEPLTEPPRVLRAIHPAGLPPLPFPETGLALPWLFTAGRGSPSLLNELRREALACDGIDILVSFITRSGVRKLIDVLRSVTAADATGAGRTRIRVLTTTYTGATELEALDELARLNGCEVRVSLDGRRTRLHAKAWIFHRRTGFGSAYVGSANLSGAALLGGLEWTVKLTQRGQEALFERAHAHFESLWHDGEFAPFSPDDPAVRGAVAEALARESGRSGTAGSFFFDIQPRPYQREILAELEYERAQGRNRSLVVAATGTGKTVVAALDYRRTCEGLGHRPRLLFVAHRAQILRQALRTYREVLRDHSFGELLTGGATPLAFDHLFASIDSLSGRDLVARLGAGYWHTVVIDECHRIAAERFHRLATTLQPRLLLGLTATPERTDGRPISGYFTPRPDGSPAAELRLWDALEMQLLAPFEYYAIDDETDFSRVGWNTAREAQEISLAVVGNRRRAKLVIDEWRRLAPDPRRGRALVFCASVEHARFMAGEMERAGLPVLCVTGDTPKAEQLRAPQRLASGDVCALVTVDLYNEGVDLPDVDTLLLLRPTQSPVLFQQQIGRGLRLAPGKESCLVLDFVGVHRADFRFDRLLGSVTGLTRRELVDAVEHGFVSLPPGCHVQLQPRTREQVLHSLRTMVQGSWGRLATELAAYAALRRGNGMSLGGFLAEQQLPLREVYRDAGPSGWTALKRKAGVLPADATETEVRLARSFRHLLHVDDPAQLALLRRIAESPATYAPASPAEATRARMAAHQLVPGSQPVRMGEIAAQLAAQPEAAGELRELVDVLEAHARVGGTPLPGAAGVPLSLHGAYRIREVLAAFGFHDGTRRPPFQAGVLPLKERRCELLFVTLDKSAGYHDRIAYRDYAVSPSRFHWQTQNRAGPDTPSGRRYLESGRNGWSFQLFVRATREDAYRACGPVRLDDPADVSGDRPMSINWTLEVPLPPKLFAEFSVLRG